jgi:hypothetical protein
MNLPKSLRLVLGLGLLVRVRVRILKHGFCCRHILKVFQQPQKKNHRTTGKELSMATNKKGG